MVTQELSPADWGKQTDCCNVILTVVLSDSIVWSNDKAHFHISSTVNKQNIRYWAAKNPRTIHQRPIHIPKVTVWCALSTVGPYFFEEVLVTVTVRCWKTF